MTVSVDGLCSCISAICSHSYEDTDQVSAEDGLEYEEYRRTCYESDSRGNLRIEADILNRTAWNFNRKLRYAEKHRRLRKYVHAMAASKKIPPDLYAETMNEF